MKKIITVVYDFALYPAMDKKIETVAGRTCGGSGAGMGERDMSWYNLSEKTAERMRLRLEAAFPDVTVTMVDDVD